MAKTWREELAWAAGLFDGEGHVGSRTEGRGRHAHVALIDISQNDRRVLDRFRDAVGHGKVYGPYRQREGRNPQFHYAAYRFEKVQAIMAMLWEFLAPVKRAQAAAALSRVIGSYRTSLGKPKDRAMCKRGHPFDEKNTNWYTTKLGYRGRRCRACGREKMARLWQVKKTARALLTA